MYDFPYPPDGDTALRYAVEVRGTRLPGIQHAASRGVSPCGSSGTNIRSRRS